MMSARYFKYYTIILRGAVFSWTHCICQLSVHHTVTCITFVSDIAVFVLKRDVKLQLTN